MRVATIVDPLGLVPLAGRVTRRAADEAADRGGRLAVAALERALRSPRAEEALDLVLASALLDAAVRGAVERGVVERVTAELLESGAVDRIVDQVLDTPLPDHVADRVLLALDGPRATELAQRFLDSEGMDRLIAQVFDSRLLDASVARVLASEELWLVVDEVASSPAVTAAITQQSVGFADQVAVEVGERSRRADARLERIARRILHRPPPPDAAPT